MRHVSEAIGQGGRLGSIESLSGSYQHEVRIPGVKRTGVTPEELLAGAWAACFGMVFIELARAAGLDATDVRHKASVVLEADRGEYTITEATLEVLVPDIEPPTVARLIDDAHRRCPVSKLLTGGVASVDVRAAAGPLSATPEPTNEEMR